MSDYLYSGQQLFFFLLAVVLPIAALVALATAHRMAPGWARAAVKVAASLVIFFLVILFFTCGSYLWALHLEGRWTAAKPTTRSQLESCLALYSQRDIPPSQSGWGRNHQLGPGERMTQYLLLYQAPFEVVYTSDDKIVAMYTSYE